MGVNKMFFSSGKTEYNLEIGGVYPNTISNELQLSAKFSFSVSDIQDFTIDGNDIKANITAIDVSSVNNAFYLNTDITYFRAYGNWYRYTTRRDFRECPNLTEFIVDSDEFVIALNYISINPNLSLSNIKIKNAIITSVGSPSSTSAGGYVSVNGGGILDWTSLITSYADIPIFAMFSGVNTGIIDMSKATTLDFTNNTFSNRRFLENFSSTIRIWSCTNLMPTHSINGTVSSGFTGTHNPANMTIEINVINKTINGGNPHADLTDAIGRGATVIYTDSNGVPQP